MSKLSDKIKGGISDTYTGPDFDALNVEQNWWIHHKHPETKYILYKILPYENIPILNEGDELIYYTTADEDCDILNSNVKHYEIILENPFYRFRYKGKLESKNPVETGTLLVMYINTETKIIWFRPLIEFQDGRFTEVVRKPEKKAMPA